MTTTVKPGSTELRKLVQAFKPGYTLRPSGRSHFTVLDPDGNPVQLPDGSGRPLKLPNSPGAGTVPEHARRLKAAGVVLSTRTRRNGRKAAEQPTDPRQDTLQRQQQERADQTAHVFDQLDRTISLVGGWDGARADLALIAHTLGQNADDPDALPNPREDTTAYAQITRARNGGGMLLVSLRQYQRVADQLAASPDPVYRWFELVRQARNLPAPTQGVWQPHEWPFDIKLLHLDKLFPDHRYQRPADRAFIRKHAPIFDETLVGVIDVSARAQGTFAVMDGQQRVEIMRLVGKTGCFCAIYTGMDVRAEARFFHHKNRDRKTITPYYNYRARLVGEEPLALTIKAICDAYGFAVAPRSDDDTRIAAVRALEAIHAYKTDHLDSCLPATLSLVASVWRGRKLSTDADVLRGLGRFFQTYLPGEYDSARLSDVLHESSPVDVAILARDRVSRSRGSSNGWDIRDAIVAIYNRKQAKEARLPARPRT